MIILQAPVERSVITGLKCGDQVLLSGTLFTARDAAHKRFMHLIKKGKPLPVDLTGQLLYYTGPTPPKPGDPIGSAGPTTSSRMDRYTPRLIAAAGLSGIIGKGARGSDVVAALQEHHCVYFAATGGAGALLGECVTKARVVCYEDLGPEAVFELEVKNFPLVVAVDTDGNSCYEEGPRRWREKWRPEQ